MKNKLLLFSLIPLLAGCVPAQPIEEGNLIELTDGQGRTVQIDKTKRDRVICIGAGALRFYSYIGDLSKIVAVEDFETTTKTYGFGGQVIRPYYHVNKTFFDTLPSCGRGGPAAQAPEKEEILKTNPNVIVSFYSAEVNNTLSQEFNIPVIGLKQGPEGVFDTVTKNSFTILGKAFSKESRATELINYIDGVVTELSALSESNDSYYVGCIGNWGKTSIYGTMLNNPTLKYAKVKDALKDLDLPGMGQVEIDQEKLLQINPDKIILDSMNLSGFINQYKENKETLNALDAFKNKETYVQMPYNAYYTNLEVQLMTTYYVASISHEMSNFNIATKSDEILTKFVGKACYNELLEYSIAYGGYAKIDMDELSK